jgi:phospholipase C
LNRSISNKIRPYRRALAAALPTALIGVLFGLPLAGGKTLAGQYTGQAQTPIEHVVIIHKENRSFDTYFGKFPGANGATQGEMHDGTIIDLVPPLDPTPNDIGHSNSAFYLAYNDGAMNGFDLEGGAFTKDGYPIAYQQFDQSTLPNYWAYASRYALGDNMFSEFKGASFSNAVFRFAAQAGLEDPTTGNSSIFGLPSGPNRPVFDRMGCDEPPDHDVKMQDADGDTSHMWPCYSFKALPNILTDYGVPWKLYGQDRTEGFAFAGLDAIAQARYDPEVWSNVSTLDQFMTDAQTGNLPAVSWIQPVHTEHPNMGVACLGENESTDAINAIMNGPDWPSTAIIITWDEWGGFFDHVSPPQADFVSYGFRVPLLVISPFARYGSSPDGGSVNSTFFSHSSVLKFVEDNWNLPSLTTHDANANDMMDVFDFSQTPKAPLILQDRQCPQETPEMRERMKHPDSWDDVD